MVNPAILAVDDDPLVLRVISEILKRDGFEVATAPDGSSGIEAASKSEFGVAIVDQYMPGMSGIETIRALRRVSPDMELFLLTGHPSLESALEAIRERVAGYMCKPVTAGDLTLNVRRAVEHRSLLIQNRELLRQLEIERNRLRQRVVAAEGALERLSVIHQFVGRSDVIMQVRRQIAEVAPTDMTVLLQGESGTGKEVVARLISDLSDRGTGSFVKINCPAIPETLLESDLFGHEPGAFTGAERRKPGRFELAAEGTIFLDEIGDLPLPLQTKLLQVIEQKEFTRVGGAEAIRVNTRVIAATNASLEQMIAEGRFRADLFYRLNQYTIVLPPLRQRIEDIPILVEHFLNKHANTLDAVEHTLSSETMSRLMEYAWPGNVRELEAVIRRFALTGQEDSILSRLSSSNGVAPPTPIPATPASMSPAPSPPFASTRLQEAEVRTILTALTQNRWNQRRAAESLGISYSTLRRRIAKYKLKEPVPQRQAL
ncbi:sigma-54-dependent Fis family transcriptional regulator [Candidatus Sumerlaeota bacterium]|nr:sigma-54-dependent Fis family transcriptional regulator [Candidatus Sumerlaeota bacterium]